MKCCCLLMEVSSTSDHQPNTCRRLILHLPARLWWSVCPQPDRPPGPQRPAAVPHPEENQTNKEQHGHLAPVYWFECLIRAESSAMNTHMKWLQSHLRSNYQFGSCGGDSWGVSQRGKSVQLNCHQSVPWRTCDIPRYSKTIIVPAWVTLDGPKRSSKN